jgi:uncharacterized protein YndB with AHSA1/START domain
MLGYDIRIRKELAAPPDLVWRALIEPVLLSQWLMDNDFVPEVGHRFTFRAKPTPLWDGIVRCEVQDVQPTEALAYSWTGASDMPETVVSWNVRPTQSGTLLVFRHSGFRGLKFALIGRLLDRGWRDMIGRKLPAVLAKLVLERSMAHSA